MNQINVKISSNTTANALSVLNNSADIYDFADTIPPSVLAQVESQASDRYSKVVQASTYYFFLNTKTKPFSSQLAREAVVIGLDRNALARLGSGYFIPGCYSAAADDDRPPDAALPVRRSVRAGTWPRPSAGPAVGHGRQPVTVWGETTQPRQQFDRLLHELPQPDRLQGDREDHRRRDVLPDDRQPEAQPADRLCRLEPGLPEPDRLLRDPGRRRSRSRRPTTRTSARSTIRPQRQGQLAGQPRQGRLGRPGQVRQQLAAARLLRGAEGLLRRSGATRRSRSSPPTGSTTTPRSCIRCTAGTGSR